MQGQNEFAALRGISDSIAANLITRRGTKGTQGHSRLVIAFFARVGRGGGDSYAWAYLTQNPLLLRLYSIQLVRQRMTNVFEWGRGRG